MRKFAAAFGVLAFFAAVGSASATTITYELVFVFSGTVTPQNTLKAVFDDGGGSGSVTLTLSMSGPSTTEFVSDWYFNYTDFGTDAALASLVFTPDVSLPLPISTGVFALPAIARGSNAFQADGDGLYDIELAFASKAADRFDTGDVLIYTITGAGIEAENFNQLSAPAGAGNSGPFFTAAHQQGIAGAGTGCPEGTTCSAWVTIPEPGAALLFGISFLLVGAAIQRRS